jgi:hypothetical protein
MVDDDDVTHRYHDMCITLWVEIMFKFQLKIRILNFNIQYKWKLPIKKILNVIIKQFYVIVKYKINSFIVHKFLYNL